ncbi:MAG: leucine-rich repeat domain-containing protein, partial [Clostridiales bacterium]|nr:leucine-rich repeat domain-containing protein [Clostridiales bacterium]
MKKLWTWLLAAALLITGCAVQGNTARAAGNGEPEERVSGDFTYTLNDSGEAVITGYSGNDSELTVPDKVDEYPVAEIGAEAFSGCYNLTGITLLEGLQSIGDQAFFECESLTGITLPKGLQSIGDYAFFSCGSLTSMTLPEGLQSIGDRAFSNCKNLTSMTLPEGLQSIGVEAFSFCNSLTGITLPDSVETMGGNPFVGTKAELLLSPDHPRFALVDGMLI